MLQGNYNSPCAMGWTTRFDSQKVHKLFSFPRTSRQGLRPTQRSIQMVTGRGGETGIFPQSYSAGTQC